MITSKVKVYELAKELGQDSQNMVDVIQRLGIDIKNSMSVLGSEEVRTVRDHYRKNRTMTRPAPVSTVAKSPVTEKRVGATVIRRRAKADDPKAAPTAEETAAVEEENLAPSEETAPVMEAEAPQAEEEVIVEAQPEVVEETPAPIVEPLVQETKVEAAPVAPAAPAKVAPPVAKTAPPMVTKTVAPPPPVAPPKAPVVPAVETMAEKRRRMFPSIIKKVSVETHLVQTVGAKVEKRERPKPAPIVARPRPGVAAPGAVGTGLKRIREVEVPAPTDAAKDAARSRGRGARGSETPGTFKSADFLKRELIHATKKKKNVINRPAMKTQLTKPAEHKRVVEMGEKITVANLAKEIGVKAAALVGKLMGMGVTAGINQPVDLDTATLVAQEYGYEVKQQVFKEENFVPTLDLSTEKVMDRAPVVTIMGHVDHGKTSLLDFIRKAKVAAGEAGGITQHVAAYTVKIPKGSITFVDTPGHEAFTAMRARGAKVTDIVILVVSAVDGVMPQTVESLNHAKAANVPIVVAVNKIDLPDGNPDRIKQTLAGLGLNPEEWGGDTIFVPVSAKTGQGVDQLLESVLLQAEVLELKANFDCPARGTVVESRLDKAKGPIAAVLVQHGKLKPGDIAVCGKTYGRIRAMTNSFGVRITEANPSDPVEILGLPEVPSVGDDLFVVADEKTARELTTARIDIAKNNLPGARNKLTIEEMMATGAIDKELRIILKSDVQGSAEALKEALSKITSEKVKMKLLHTGTGGVTESDVMLATASRAVILGFNIRPDVKAQKLAEVHGIEIRTYNIIYELLDEAKKMMEGLLDKVVREKVIGRAEVREIFSVPKIGVIAGSAVIDGKVIRGCFLRLLRDSRVIYEGKISSLRRFKEDVKEVAQGFECGIGLENFNDLKLGDQFEAFLKEESKGSL